MVKEKKVKEASGKTEPDKDLSNIFKKYGKDAIMTSATETSARFIIPSTSLGLNMLLGCGGAPNGRIIELFGPEAGGKTFISLDFALNCQKLGKNVCFIDAEQALDIFLVRKLGIDESKFVCLRPEYSRGEQVFEMLEDALDSGQFGLIIVDSVASLAPSEELDGALVDVKNRMGLVAKMMSVALRKLTGKIAKSNASVIFVNQVRDNLGSTYGCLHADTLVNVENKGAIPIRTIVDKKIEGNVYSYNKLKNTFETNPIIGWHNNGRVADKSHFIHIETESINSNGGVFGITVTPFHEVLTKEGYKKAKDISIKDYLVSKYEQIINGSLEHFVNGMLVGDSCLSIRSRNTACLKIQDNINKQYVAWKIDKLSPFIKFKKSGKGYSSGYNYEWKKIKDALGERDPMYMLERYNALSMALWIMDDGCLKKTHNSYVLSVKRYSKNTEYLKVISKKLEELGFNNSFGKDGSIRFTVEASKKIANDICKYIPECMQYKLPQEFRGKYRDVVLYQEGKFIKEAYVKVTSIREASDRQIRQNGKYDLTVANNHNYMVGGKNNGVVVHNSPETTPGGRALKFFSSIRLRVNKVSKYVGRRGFYASKADASKTDDIIIGQQINVSIEKNKMAAPVFSKAEFYLHYNLGIDKYNELMSIGKALGLLTKAHGEEVYTFGDKTIDLTNGKRIDEKTFEEIKNAVYAKAKADAEATPVPLPIETTSEEE